MTKDFLAALVFSLAFGTAVAWYHVSLITGIAIFLFFSIIFHIFLQRKEHGQPIDFKSFILTALVFALGFLNAHFRSPVLFQENIHKNKSQNDSQIISCPVRQDVAFKALVLSSSEKKFSTGMKSSEIILQALPIGSPKRAVSLTGTKIKAIIYSDKYKFFAGDEVDLTAQLNFSVKNYERSRGISARASKIHINSIKAGQFNRARILRNLQLFREKFIEIHKLSLSSRISGLIQKLLLDRASHDDLDSELKNKAYKLGISHILAASGLHVSMVAFLIIWVYNFIFQYGSLSYLKESKLKYILVFFGITFYCLLGGWSPSLLRSWSIGALCILAKLINKNLDFTKTLLITCSVQLFFDPDSIGDLGFQFSYLSTLSLVLFNKKLVEKMSFLPESLAELFAVPISAQVLSMPLQILHFGTISTYFLPANLILVPFSSVILGFSLLSSLISVLTPVGFLISRALEWILEGLSQVFIYLINFMASLPLTLLPVQDFSVFWCAWLYLLIFSVFLFWNKRYSFHVLLGTLLIGFGMQCLETKALTINSLSGKNYEAVLLQTPENKNILICSTSEPQERSLDLSSLLIKWHKIFALDWSLGNCRLSDKQLRIRRSIDVTGIKASQELEISKHIKLKYNQNGSVLKYKNFSGLFFFQPMGSENKENFSLVKILKSHTRAKSFCWSQLPSAEYIFLPSMSQKDSESVRGFLGETYVYDNFESRYLNFKTDGKYFWTEKKKD